MSAERLFLHQSNIPGTIEQVWNFHAGPDAFQRLAMPPMVAKVQRDQRSSLKEGTIEFTLWVGPLPIHWQATHLPGPTDTSFIDRMDSGPLAEWEHTHLLEKSSGGVRLTDSIKFRHQPGPRGWFTRLLFDGLPLRMLFIYRHWRTRRDVAASQTQDLARLRDDQPGNLSDTDISS
jgi:ligand-binding SRPBCC domain-containing protein